VATRRQPLIGVIHRTARGIGLPLPRIGGEGAGQPDVTE
jgi:hypothetical protein